MAWVRIDDGMAGHPKVIDAGPLALAMQVAALCYCNQQLTDGRLPSTLVRTLIDLHEFNVDGEDVAGDLVEAGLWHEAGHGCEDCPQVDRGYVIHHYMDYQPTKAQVVEKQGKARDRMRKARSSDVRANTTRTSPEVPESSPNPVPDPVPTTNTNHFVATGVATSPKKPRKAPTYTVDFTRFWDNYPRNPNNGKPGGGGTKLEAWNEWVKLDAADQAKAITACDLHARALRKSDTPPKHAHRFLRLREFDDVLDDGRPAPDPTACPKCDVAAAQHDDLLCKQIQRGVA